MHHIRYELGIRPVVTSEALHFGTLIHAGLEAGWRAPKEEKLNDALAAIAAGEADPYERAKAEVMIAGYHERWVDEPYETLAVECSFEAPLINPSTGKPSRTWKLGGKLDAVVRDLRDGRTLIVEHKTSSEDVGAGSVYWQRLLLDSQVSTYYEGAEALGFKVDACLYDVLAKPRLIPLKANSKRAEPESPDQYKARMIELIAADPNLFYQRGDVVRLEGERAEFLFEVWQQAKMLHESRQSGFAPRNTDSCFKWNRPCEYLEVCAGRQSLDDPSRFRKLEDVHPELGEKA
jgi:hypothetical protein